MLSPEPLRGLDLMTQSKYHRTNIELELSKNKGVLCRPSPVPKDGFGRTDRTQRINPTPQPWRFLKVAYALWASLLFRLSWARVMRQAFEETFVLN